MIDFSNSALGKDTDYPSVYDAKLLFPIARSEARDALNIKLPLAFSGFDSWTAYELSWLNAKGKPVAAIGYINFNCLSPFLVESKSLKLYLNSLNMHRFDSFSQAEAVVARDLSGVSGATVNVRFLPLDTSDHAIQRWSVPSLDGYDIGEPDFRVDSSMLDIGSARIGARWQTHLFRSLCPVTSQPDWASIRIEYFGNEIDPSSLLKYLVGYRNHQGFHEQCVERIFYDINGAAQCSSLLVEARFTRRGGLDINPIRMKGIFEVKNQRLSRQ